MSDTGTPQELLRKSEIIKNCAEELFRGQDSQRAVYALAHAASSIIKERGNPYKDSVFHLMNILFHFEECKGCEDHKTKKASLINIPRDHGLTQAKKQCYEALKLLKESGGE